MSKRKPRPVITLFSENRAVSEAISQGLIFLMVITAATGVAVGSQDVIDHTRDEESFDQAVTGFEAFDNSVQSLATHGDDDIFFTAYKQTILYSRNADLVETEPTTITIRDGGQTYSVTSQPLEIQHDIYDLTYDTGILHSERVGETRIHRSPTRQHPNNQNMLRLPTLWMNESDGFAGGQEQQVLVREDGPTQILSLSDTATITVEAEREGGWVGYFEEQGYLENVGSTNTGSQFEITADFNQSATVYHQQVEVKPEDRFS